MSDDKWQRVVRFLIGLVAALGLGGLIVNTILTGRDIPAGVVTVLLSIIGAIYGMEAVGRRGGETDPPPSDDRREKRDGDML